jgi:hypothetical protein
MHHGGIPIRKSFAVASEVVMSTLKNQGFLPQRLHSLRPIAGLAAFFHGGQAK